MSFVTTPLPSRVSLEAHKWLKHKCRRTLPRSWPPRADAAAPGDPCSGSNGALEPRRALAQGRKQAGGLAVTRPGFHPIAASYRRRAFDYVSAPLGVRIHCKKENRRTYLAGPLWEYREPHKLLSTVLGTQRGLRKKQ